MRARPSSSSRSSKSSRSTKKSHNGNSKGVSKKGKDANKKPGPDLSVLRQPVDTSVCGLKQAVKVFETGTPEIVHLLTYDCDVVYECKVCRNLFRSIANFISHKRIYCTQRYSQSQDLQRSNKQEQECKIVLGEKVPERLPTRITARKDLTSIVESLANQRPSSQVFADLGAASSRDGERRETTVHLEPMENTSYGVFQTVLKSDNQNLMRNQVTELQNLLAKNEVVLGPDGRILKNGFSDLHQEEADTGVNGEGVVCNICDAKLANRKTLAKHKRILHETVKTNYVCPSCKHYFSSIWSVYRHLYKVHRKSTEQVRRLRTQILRKEVRVEKPMANDVDSNKKLPSPKKKVENQLPYHQANKECLGHFGENGEIQRCGGCGRKFERKAALLSHLQICHKRIADSNKIEQNHQIFNGQTALNPVVALSPLPVSKKPIPKPTTEKKIGIQVRMDYFKNNSGSPNQVVCRQRSSSRSVLGDESDIEALSVDGRDSLFLQEKDSLDFKEGSVLEQLFQSSNKCKASDGVDKVHSYLNHSKNGLEEIQTYEISTCKRSTVLRSNIGKSRNLEAKCLQLRSALENGVAETTKKDCDVSIFLDNNLDNTSESNTSAISSLSSQLTPLVDKGFVCEVEQSIEIKNINICRSPEKNIPRTEADSTSSGNLQMTCHLYKENIKFSPTKESPSEEVSTSVICDSLPDLKFNNRETRSFNDDEVSLDLKPVSLLQIESKDAQHNDLGNTISILTRNQLKAICKEDLPAKTGGKQSGTEVDLRTKSNKKKNVKDSQKTLDSSGVEEKSKQLYEKRFKKFIDRNKGVCKLCNNRFANIGQLYRHVAIHTKWRRYECLYDGCDYKSFGKSNMHRHVALHTVDKKTQHSSLIAIIDSSKWDLKISDKTKEKIKAKVKPKKVIKLKKNLKATKVSNHLNKSSSSEKKKLKVNPGMKNEKIIKKVTLKSKAVGKQKLLTDFSFQKVTRNENNLETKPVQTKVKPKPKSGFVPRNKRRFVNTSEDEQKMASNQLKTNPMEQDEVKPHLKKLKSSLQGSKKIDSTPSLNSDKPAAKNSKQLVVCSVHESKESSNAPVKEEKVPEKTQVKKLKLSLVDPTEHTSENLIVSKKEDIIVNHVTEEHNEINLTRVRSSRASSRKASLNSHDQQKGKSSNSPVIKIEDQKTSQPVISDTSNSMYIQSPAIVDGSLEEEESQEESDKPVDDSHLQKIYMEVIFGSDVGDVAPTSSRPIRNKIRPKKMNDCIMNNLKDKEKESLDDRSVAKKPKSTVDLKTLPEVPTRKSK